MKAEHDIRAAKSPRIRDQIANFDADAHVSDRQASVGRGPGPRERGIASHPRLDKVQGPRWRVRGRHKAGHQNRSRQCRRRDLRLGIGIKEARPKRTGNHVADLSAKAARPSRDALGNPIDGKARSSQRSAPRRGHGSRLIPGVGADGPDRPQALDASRPRGRGQSELIIGVARRKTAVALELHQTQRQPTPQGWERSSMLYVAVGRSARPATDRPRARRRMRDEYSSSSPRPLRAPEAVSAPYTAGDGRRFSETACTP